MKLISKTELKDNVLRVLNDIAKNREPYFITENDFPIFEITSIKPKIPASDAFAKHKEPLKVKPDCWKYNPKEWGDMGL